MKKIVKKQENKQLQKKIEEKKKIDFKYNLSIYFGFLKKHKLMAMVVAILMIIIQLRYLLDKFLFKFIIDKGTEFTAGVLPLNSFVSFLLILAYVYLGILVVSAFLHWTKENLVIKLETRMIFDLKQKFFNHILGLHHEFHTTHKTGSLISRLLRGGSALERVNDSIIYNFAPLIINIVAVTISLFYFDTVSAFIVLGIAVAFLAYGMFIQKLQETSNLRANVAEDIEKANVSDFFTNVDSIKYFGKQKTINKRYKDIADNTRLAYVKMYNYFRWYGSVLHAIIGIGTFLLIFFSIRGFLAGNITLGTLVFIYTVYGSLVNPMWSFMHGIRNYYRSMADFQDLFQYGKIENEIKDKSDAKELSISNGEIDFKDITFKYGKRKIFEKFNLKIPSTKKVALVGHSGCGKTTLLKILYRLYDLDKGQILIDDQNITDFKQESLRSEMSIVPQECILFDDTIYNNIKFSNLKADKEHVMKAIKFAQLDRITQEFPQKENTIVGERGVKLSGGEKQRVSIARALLADKKILVLDEATSSLDSETEHEIQKDLEKLMQNRTSIIIAHRLSTIMKADTIVVMKKGEIVQMGNHNQLIQQEGEYKRLWNLQKGGYIR